MGGIEERKCHPDQKISGVLVGHVLKRRLLFINISRVGVSIESGVEELASSWILFNCLHHHQIQILTMTSIS